MLTALGHRHWAVPDSQAAHAVLKGLGSAAVLCDVELGREDGVELCLTIRRCFPRLRIALMTGNPAAARRGEEEGFGEALAKPFTIIELEKLLRELGADDLGGRPG